MKEENTAKFLLVYIASLIMLCYVLDYSEKALTIRLTEKMVISSLPFGELDKNEVALFKKYIEQEKGELMKFQLTPIISATLGINEFKRNAVLASMVLASHGNLSVEEILTSKKTVLRYMTLNSSIDHDYFDYIRYLAYFSLWLSFFIFSRKT